jgi:NADH dehydrogenase
MSRIYTVFGGTGFLGQRVVASLLEGGHRVRIAARHPQSSSASLAERVEAVRADLFEPESLLAALRGADGAVNATSLYLEKGPVTFDAVHVEGAARLAGLARQSGVKHFVQLSGLGADASANDPYIRSRGKGEQAVTSAFPGAFLVRPSAMFGPGDGLVSAILGVARRLPVYPLFGAGATRLQPAYVEDVGQAIARLVRGQDAAPVHEFGGPRVFSYRDLVETVAAAAGLEVRPVPVPFAAWRMMSAIAEKLPGAPLTRSQVALMRHDNVASRDLPGLRALGVEPRDIEAFVRTTIGEAKG